MDASTVATHFEMERDAQAQALAARKLEAWGRVQRLREQVSSAGDDEHALNASLILAKLEMAKVDAAWVRADQPFPRFDICPRCWIESGTEKPAQDIGWTALMVHQSPRDPSFWGCAHCRWSICGPPRSRS